MTWVQLQGHGYVGWISGEKWVVGEEEDEEEEQGGEEEEEEDPQISWIIQASELHLLSL